MNKYPIQTMHKQIQTTQLAKQTYLAHPKDSKECSFKHPHLTNTKETKERNEVYLKTLTRGGCMH